MSGSDHGGYRVGKGRPPLDTRFKPGISGNPRGRPRTKALGPELPPRISRTLRKMLDEPITVNRGGRQQKISKRELILEQMFICAVQGDVRAGSLLLRVGQKAEMQEDAARANLFDTALGLKLDRTSALEQWVAAGRSEESFPVHPDDIELDPLTLTVKCRTPVTREDVATEQKLLQHRARLETGRRLIESMPKLAYLREEVEADLEQIESILRPTLRRKKC